MNITRSLTRRKGNYVIDPNKINETINEFIENIKSAAKEAFKTSQTKKLRKQTVP